MLGKLIKHEFRETCGFIALLCAGLLGFSALTRLLMLLSEQFDLLSIPLAISMFFYVVLAVVSIVIVYVMIIRRFYMNVFGDEGYLTLTLPVEKWKIIVSKLIVGAVYVIVDLAVTAGSVLIVGMSSDFFKALDGIFEYFSSFVMYVSRFLAIPLWVLVLEVVLFVLIGLAYSILNFYASISIGQLFTGHRLIGSVLGYLMISTASSIVMNGYTIVIGMTQKNISEYMQHFESGSILNSIGAFNVQIYVILYLVIMAVLAAVLYYVTNHIMKRAVNLQ